MIHDQEVYYDYKEESEEKVYLLLFILQRAPKADGHCKMRLVKKNELTKDQVYELSISLS